MSLNIRYEFLGRPIISLIKKMRFTQLEDKMIYYLNYRLSYYSLNLKKGHDCQ